MTKKRTKKRGVRIVFADRRKKWDDPVGMLNRVFAEIEVGIEEDRIRDEQVALVRMSARTARQLALDPRLAEILTDKRIWGAKVVLSRKLPYGEVEVVGVRGGTARGKVWPRTKKSTLK
jgi:hypothetical protein